MAVETQFLTGSIDDYLLGLADGIQKAQRQLAQMSVTLQAGESPVSYQIPRVDFELKMSLEVASPADGAEAGTSSMLRFRPASPGRGSGVTAEASSVIRGSFVAVPMNAGKPPPAIRTSLKRVTDGNFEVSVQVASAAGELLSGVDVQFNVDRERSRELKVVRDAKQPVAVADRNSPWDGSSFDDPDDLEAGTIFWDGLVTTGADGVAKGVLNIDRREAPGTLVAVVVDALGQTESIVFKVE